MSDELLPYYDEELAAIRHDAAEFAKTHSEMAERLRLGPEDIEDPHVGRLVEAFAYLNARIRRKLDDEFPELTDAMLGVLYPHYQAPMPSMAIVQLLAQSDATSPYTVETESEIETQPVSGEPCRFRTCYPVTLWPVRVAGAALAGSMVGAPSVPMGTEVASVLRLDLACTADDLELSALAPERLRFHLKGQPQHVLPLYELLLNDTLEILLVNDSGISRRLGPDAIRAVGFDASEGLLPYPPQAFVGYRLLSEYFAFPQKFLFVELTGLARALKDVGNTARVYFYLRRGLPELEPRISAETFALGCTPIVNLHRRRAEPIQFDHAHFEYRIVPDARRPKAFEVYQVDGVAAVSADGHSRPYRAFYGIDHYHGDESVQAFWKASRRQAPEANPGSEVYLSLVDLALNPHVAPDSVVNARVTCLNRDLPSKLPFGGGQPHLRFSEGASAVRGIQCLTAPTPTLRPALRKRAMWRLVSHLTLNHLSISHDEEGAKALREILSLYDVRNSDQTRDAIEGIVSVSSRPTTARVRVEGQRPALTRGVEVSVELDPRRFVGGSVFLFASLLERFLGLYCNVNSFTRLVASVRGREGVLRRWQPRAGDRTLV